MKKTFLCWHCLKRLNNKPISIVMLECTITPCEGCKQNTPYTIVSRAADYFVEVKE